MLYIYVFLNDYLCLWPITYNMHFTNYDSSFLSDFIKCIYIWIDKYYKNFLLVQPCYCQKTMGFPFHIDEVRRYFPCEAKGCFSCALTMKSLQSTIKLVLLSKWPVAVLIDQTYWVFVKFSLYTTWKVGYVVQEWSIKM